MKLRITRIISLVILVAFLIPTTHCSAYSSASGYEDIEPGVWWYYPMVIGSGNLLQCQFHTDGLFVEHFIIHGVDYEENATLDYDLLLYHGNSISDEYQMIIPRDGGWYWVFINHNSIEVRVHYEWDAFPQGLQAVPLSIYVASVGFGMLFVLGMIFYFRSRKSK